jgi:hypothetical protein
MRTKSSFLALAALAVSAAAQAAPPPAGVLLSGVVGTRLTNVSGAVWCMVDGGVSEFQTSGNGALISLPSLLYTENGSLAPIAYNLTGQAVVTFSAGSSTSGVIKFNNPFYPANIKTLPFSNYAANYDANQRLLTVSFRVQFPQCSVPVAAAYRN